MNENNCTNCAFAVANQQYDRQGNAIVGKYDYFCHRAPPSVVAVPQGAIMGFATAFPKVSDETFCAMFEAKESVLKLDG